MGIKGFLERRRHARVPGSVPAEFEVEAGASVETFASNFSLGGLFVMTSDPPGEGRAVKVRLLPNGGDPIEARGVVAWVSRFRVAPGFGIQLSEEEAQRLGDDAGYRALLAAAPKPEPG